METVNVQAQYTEFVRQVNRSLTHAGLNDFHEARASAAALLHARQVTPEMAATTQAMLEQLHWWPEARGDLEAGERIQPLGYPYGSVYLGDAVELAEHIPDASVDLIFTDPPYVRESMHTYGWLGETANRILTPNGFLLAYVGVFWKDNAMAQLREHMSFFWDYAVSHDGRHPLQRNRMTRSAHKSVLCYRRPDSRALPRIEVEDLIQGGGKDKEYHPWGQSVDEARYFIEGFSRPGDVVLDPFMGGGTTAVAGEQSDRRWFGFEVDSEYASAAQDRIEICRVDRHV